VETSVNGMLTNNEAPMDVIELDKKAKKKGYVNSGTLFAKSVSIEHRPTFTDVSRSNGGDCIVCTLYL
jgi:hypothetical protein